jgi:hypothetical protein
MLKLDHVVIDDQVCRGNNPNLALNNTRFKFNQGEIIKPGS